MTDVDAGGKNLVFVVGAPRSGTSWLSRLMGAHTDVAAMQETELLNRYCAPWYDAWDDQLPADMERWSRQRHRGLPAVLTTDEMDEQAQGFARNIYAKALTLKPTARVVVDKNPAYSLHIALARRMFPDAAVLHIVRDGRDVVASMLAASRGWGRDWAPATVRLAARTWRVNVEGASSALRSGRYHEVRYDDLMTRGPQALAECLAFAGVMAAEDECADIISRVEGSESPADPLLWSGEVVKRLGAPPPEPAGFFGRRSSGGWQETFSTRDRLEFHLEAGELLCELGYEADEGWVTASRVRMARAAAARRLTDKASRLGWRIHMALGRRGVYLQVGRVAPYQRDDERLGG